MQGYAMSQEPDLTFIGDVPKFTELEQALARCEQSWCDFAYSVRTGMRFQCNTAGVVTRHGRTFVQVREQFDVYKGLIEGDEPSALVRALHFACKEGLPLPYWLSHRVCAAIDKTFATETTLHEAFSLSTILPESGKKAGIARRRIQESVLLRSQTRGLMHEQKIKSLDVALRRVLKAGKFSFGLTVARRLFNERDRKQRLFLGRKDKHR